MVTDLASLKNYEEHLNKLTRLILDTSGFRSQLRARQYAEKLFLRKLKSDFYSNNQELLDRKPFECYGTESTTTGASVLGFKASATSDNSRSYDIPADTKFLDLVGDRKFDNFTAGVYTYFHGKLDSTRKTLLLRYLYGKAFAMTQHTKGNEVFTYGRRNIAYHYISHVIDKLTVDFDSLDGMRIQIHEIVGKSGIGKSVAVFELQFLVHALLPVIPCGDVVYSRANDYWWNGYEGQLIVLYDDFTHSKKLKFDLHYELISLASGTLKKPPMAFVKDMPFTSSAAYVTSNIPVLTTVHVGATVAALKRRIISQTYEPLPGCFDSENKRYKFRGALCNLIRANGNNIFSTFSETISIISGKNSFEIEEDELIEFLDDDPPQSPRVSPVVSFLQEHLDAFIARSPDCPMKEMKLADHLPPDQTYLLARKLDVLQHITFGYNQEPDKWLRKGIKKK